MTDREVEIIRLVAEGNTSKEIAQMLGVSVRTVDNHRTNINRKLKAENNRTRASVADVVRFAVRFGITGSPAAEGACHA